MDSQLGPSYREIAIDDFVRSTICWTSSTTPACNSAPAVFNDSMGVSTAVSGVSRWRH